MIKLSDPMRKALEDAATTLEHRIVDYSAPRVYGAAATRRALLTRGLVTAFGDNGNLLTAEGADAIDRPVAARMLRYGLSPAEARDLSIVFDSEGNRVRVGDIVEINDTNEDGTLDVDGLQHFATRVTSITTFGVLVLAGLYSDPDSTPWSRYGQDVKKIDDPRSPMSCAWGCDYSSTELSDLVDHQTSRCARRPELAQPTIGALVTELTDEGHDVVIVAQLVARITGDIETTDLVELVAWATDAAFRRLTRAEVEMIRSQLQRPVVQPSYVRHVDRRGAELRALAYRRADDLLAHGDAASRRADAIDAAFGIAA